MDKESWTFKGKGTAEGKEMNRRSYIHPDSQTVLNSAIETQE